MNDNHLQIAEMTLNTDEGLGLTPYQDSRGIWSVGFGFNLETTPMPRKVAVLWLTCLVEDRDSALETKLKYYSELSDARKAVLINMSYQLGVQGLMNFKNMHKALMADDFVNAVDEMKDSRWYRRFTNRADRLCFMMQFDRYASKRESKSFNTNL